MIQYWYSKIEDAEDLMMRNKKLEMQLLINNNKELKKLLHLFRIDKTVYPNLIHQPQDLEKNPNSHSLKKLRLKIWVAILTVALSKYKEMKEDHKLE